ncbi:hypothetical protein [Methylocaldum szegediense]|uniref:Uncharacterized protein n=1 Tax=Methylocaldum szegediense TaxID=73780 RepID=A0ABN8X7M0_9GAMM|nr:hypothetical protein [Methylocaldum szegediense]CAI8927565.1 conserved membrane protein of unknown function [Methylocaldum szegediense]
MQRAISLNFRFSVWVSILGGILALSNFSLVVPDGAAFYGPMRNNLFLVVAYLVISQIVLWYFRYRRSSRNEVLLMGLIFLLTAGGVAFYALLNELPVSLLFILALAYLGFSHILFYFAPRIAAGSAEYPSERKN